MAAIVDALSAYQVSLEQIEVFSIGTGNPPYEIGRLAARGGLFQWRELIKGAMFLTTDNADAQATLLLGPEKILRLAPAGAAAEIELDDWESAVKVLPSLAGLDFENNKHEIEKFFQKKVAARHRFYSASNPGAR